MFKFLKDNRFDVKEYSPLSLAYVGDSVYDLFIRTKLVLSGDKKVNDLHKEATRFVSAHGQHDTFHLIEDILSEEELRIFKWGRNTKSSATKNANVTEYRHATGFETLLGYLYLTGNFERLDGILNTSYERRINENSN